MNKERKEIYDKTGGKCYYCGCDLPKRWHADHVIPLRRIPEGIRDERGKLLGLKYDNNRCENEGFDTVENKVPSCPRCNIRKNTESVEQFRKSIKSQVDVLLRNSNPFKLALDYGLIEIKDKEVEFYFEQMNNRIEGV